MDSPVTITRAAKADIAEIIRYTALKWGKAQARIYAKHIDRCFKNIASDSALSKQALPNREDIYVCRCEQHYVFYLRKDNIKAPVILAILHQHMDMLKRLAQRLQD